MLGKQTIRKVLAIVMIITISLNILSACSYNHEKANWNFQGDWDYELCQGYCIVRVNSKTIKLCIDNGVGFSTVIDSYVTSFCYNDFFIAVRHLDVKDSEITEIDFERAEYYLVNTRSDIVFGPFKDETTFKNICGEENVGQLGEWIATDPAPEGARY